MALTTILIFFPLLAIQAIGAPNFINSSCTTGNNYTETSLYKASLNQLLPSLASKASSNTFYNLTAGSEPNKVYALYYCRGDVTSQDCNECVKAATDEIVSSCPSEREAIVWYDACTLRFSNVSIFSVDVLRPGWLTWSTNNVSNPSQFLESLSKVVDQLSKQAAFNTSSKNYAKGKIEVEALQIIYCLVQCTPDLNSTQCDRCLKSARTGIPDCCSSGSEHASVNLPSCRLMYDILPFGSTEVEPPSSSPSNKEDGAPSPSSTTIQSSKTSSGKNAKFYVLAIVLPLAAASLLLGVFLFFFRRYRKSEMVSRDEANEYLIEGASQFDLGAMKAATGNFSPANKLGQGGFGVVYKGKLQNGQEVAIKRLSQESKQGIKEFINEVELVAKLQHRNLVRLVGFCTEGEERLVVYEFMPKLSLDYYLFDASKSKYLSWETRNKIIEGTARGLHYLHEDSRLKIVHRDLKISNILLDEDMNPKIADFGIAKHVVVDQTQSNTTKIIGTFGYMAPEYALAGQFSAKSDVFSFGVMLLEIVSGQSNNRQNQMQNQDGFLVNAWKCWMEGEIEELIDPTLRNTASRTDVRRCIHIGLLCVQYDPVCRPTMHAVLLMLHTKGTELESPSTPSPLFHGMHRSGTNPSREFQTGSDISTGTSIMEKDLYPR